MKIGTRSVLYGAHCFFIHPFFVAAAWTRLYGFPLDPRLWIAFFVHDLGYIGKANVDGEEGELHPHLGANIMGFLFGQKWHDFTLYHSRFLCKRYNARFSKLCVADKYSICLTPAWLYIPMATATGEIKEYMSHAINGKYTTMNVSTTVAKEWYAGVQEYIRKWVMEHKDGQYDSWTPDYTRALKKEEAWSD